MKPKRMIFKPNIKALKKPVVVIPAIIVGVIIIAFASLVIWKPGIARGEYGIQTIVDMLLNRAQKTEDRGAITDTIQPQTNQSSDEALEENTVSAPITPNTTIPKIESTIEKIADNLVIPVAPTTPAVTIDPNINGWSNSHGTFLYSDLGSVIPMFVGIDTETTVGWSEGGSCATGGKFTIPAGTKIYKNYAQISDYFTYYYNGYFDSYYPNTRTTGFYIFDLRNVKSSACGFNYYELGLSSDKNSLYYPGNLGIYW